MDDHHGTWLYAIYNVLPEAAREYITVNVLSGWVVIVALLVMARLGTRTLQLRPASGWQVLWEWAYEGFAGFCRTVIGPGGEKHAPFLGTLFIYILLMNLLGVVPGFLSPTASLTMTLALAVTAVGYVQFVGFRESGLRYLLHFVGEPWWLFPINIPLHLLGEVSRILSLAIRLFGNIFGEDTVIIQLMVMGAAVYAAWHVPIPLHFPMVLFHIFISMVQALVFMMLTAAYIAGAVAHHDGEHEHEAGHAPERARSEAA